MVVVVEVVVLVVAGVVLAGVVVVVAFVVVVLVGFAVTPVAPDSLKTHFYSFVDISYILFVKNENRAVY